MNKKSQIKFGETMGVMVVVYIVILLGFSWYNSIMTDNIVDLQNEDIKFRNNEKLEYVLNLELLKLKNRGNIKKEFDYYSLLAFKNYASVRSEKGFKEVERNLGYSLINLSILNLDFSVNNNIILFDNSLPLKDVKSQKIYKVIIPIRDEQELTTKLGIMQLILYEKS